MFEVALVDESLNNLIFLENGEQGIVVSDEIPYGASSIQSDSLVRIFYQIHQNWNAGLQTLIEVPVAKGHVPNRKAGHFKNDFLIGVQV